MTGRTAAATPDPATGDTPGALAGLRVLDLASLYAAPFISTLLADHGADVVKVEPPGGDAYRAFPNRMWPLLARNKQSVVLDLRSAEGAAAVHAMIPQIDVVIVNMPTGLLERTGLDRSTLSALNPGLIYVHVSGYGLDGPYADRPGNGTLGEAMSGLTHMTGEPDGPPVLASVPLGDAITGVTGAFGVLVACYHRLAHGGGGQLVDVNPVDAVLQTAGPMLTEYVPPELPHRLGSRLPGSLLRNVFCCSDGRWIAISASTLRHLDELCSLSGASKVDDDVESAVRAWAGGLDRTAALDRLVAHRIPAVGVHDAADVVADPHLTARRSVETVDTEEFGPVLTPAAAPRLSATPARRARRTPEPGEHQGRMLLPD